uniref:VWFA domain-containing protein n=1 Tax=Pundamilia nyererei TaxID=303518 RepID=A0A3B4H5G1_9CICH
STVGLNLTPSMLKSCLGLTCSLEVAFILDSSESATISLFEKQKTFVLSFSTRLAMLQVPSWTMKVRMAALQYSSTVSIEHRFSAWKDLDYFHGQVSTMNYIGHGTYTTYAITNASQLLVHETSKDSVRVAVLMTEGVDHPRNPDVIAAAVEAKGHGIKFFSGLNGTPGSDGPPVRKQICPLFLHNCQTASMLRDETSVFNLFESFAGPHRLQSCSVLTIETCPQKISAGSNVVSCGLVGGQRRLWHSWGKG